MQCSVMWCRENRRFGVTCRLHLQGVQIRERGKAPAGGSFDRLQQQDTSRWLRSSASHPIRHEHLSRPASFLFSYRGNVYSSKNDFAILVWHIYTSHNASAVRETQLRQMSDKLCQHLEETITNTQQSATPLCSVRNGNIATGSGSLGGRLSSACGVLTSINSATALREKPSSAHWCRSLPGCTVTAGTYIALQPLCTYSQL
jgi:hypothetical protein